MTRWRIQSVWVSSETILLKIKTFPFCIESSIQRNVNVPYMREVLLTHVLIFLLLRGTAVVLQNILEQGLKRLKRLKRNNLQRGKLDKALVYRIFTLAKTALNSLMIVKSLKGYRHSPEKVQDLLMLPHDFRRNIANSECLGVSKEQLTLVFGSVIWQDQILKWWIILKINNCGENYMSSVDNF